MNLNQISPVFKRDSIAFQLLTKVILSYFGVAALLLVGQVTISYYNVKNQVNKELRVIEEAFSPGLARALWDVNTDQVESFFKGMINLPVVVGARIEDETGETVIVSGTVVTAEGEVFSVNEDRHQKVVEGYISVFDHNARIYIQDGEEQIQVGQVTIYSSSGVVLDRVKLAIGLTLIEVFLVAAALCLIFIWLFRHHLAGPLGLLTSAVGEFDPDKARDFHLDIGITGRNELKVLEESFNGMASRLEKDRSELVGYREDLEKQVAERTAELRRASELSEHKASTETSLGGLAAGLQGALSAPAIATRTLDAMVDFLNAPVGALYVLQDDGQLHRMAHHALPPEAEDATIFPMGSGSVGAAAKSRQTLVTEPGDQNWSVSFGLGHAKPTQILTCPLMANNELGGVVEFCLFHQLSNEQIAWVEKASRISATALHYARESGEREHSEQRIRLILDSTPDCMIIIDENGEIRIANAISEEVFGYTSDELIGKPISLLVPARYHEAHLNHLSDYMKNPLARKLGDVNPVQGRRKDGSEFLAEISLSPIETSEGMLVVAAVRDVSERQQAEESMRTLSLATEKSPALIIITDREGIIEYVNAKFTEVTGYTPSEVIGENPRILKTGVQSPEFYKDLWDTILDGREWRGEFCNRKKNGETYWEHASISGIQNDAGEITHFVAVKEDITSQKHNEQEPEVRSQSKF
jgi:PAS domain S-box-containing protein